MTSSASVGKKRRLQRIFRGDRARSVIVPIDDALIFGPFNGLDSVSVKLRQITEAAPDGIVAFKGAFLRHAEIVARCALILNVTASTIRSRHTKKEWVDTIETAIRMDAAAVAVHVNISSRFEAAMLRTLGAVSSACESVGMPLVAIMYPRGEDGARDENYDEMKRTDRDGYARLVAHAARVGVDLGADVVKTQFTGDSQSFAKVVAAAAPVPLVIAGGPIQPAQMMLRIAREALDGGASGISFGRNVFGRRDPALILRALKSIVHEDADTQSLLPLPDIIDNLEDPLR